MALLRLICKNSAAAAAAARGGEVLPFRYRQHSLPYSLFTRSEQNSSSSDHHDPQNNEVTVADGDEPDNNSISKSSSSSKKPSQLRRHRERKHDLLSPLSSLHRALDNYVHRLFGGMIPSSSRRLPFSRTDHHHSELMDWFSENLLSNMAPPTYYQLAEDDKCYRVRFEMPGLSKEEVKVSVSNGYLVVEGEHKEEHDDDDQKEEEEAEGSSSTMFSRSYGRYMSRIMLPENAKADEISAGMNHGVLEVVIPKMETDHKDEENTKVIQVQ